MKPVHAIQQEGYQLLQDGAVELSVIERNGIRIDMDKLEQTKRNITSDIAQLREDMEETEAFQLWRKRFGAKTNVQARAQLSEVLFEIMGYESSAQTDAGNEKTDEEALQGVDDPLIPLWLKFAKYEKTLGTFINGIEREVVHGILHPSFNLHLVRSYRSSSDSPNFQNMPVRDKEIAQIIRSLFIARDDDHLLSENDFKGIEVSMSACYHNDPNFIDYITTPGKDMHKDMAAQLYEIDPKDVSKDARYGAKNKFVFPQFYGAWWLPCARDLWEWIDKGNLTTPDGKSLYENLASKGIHELGDFQKDDEEPCPGTFQAHVKDVEIDFWSNRFKAYGQWKKDWYQAYLEKGFFDMKTGFRVAGALNRKQACNYPIQGSAFHCLLWTLIEVNKKLRAYRMKSRIVGQIHDSIISDVRVDELRDYLEIIEETTLQLRRHWPWINVPMVIEYELSKVGGSWYDKQEIKFKEGRFVHPTDPSKKTSNAELFLKTL